MLQIPDFPVVTEAFWPENTLDTSEERAAMAAKINTMISEGKTNGKVYQDAYPAPYKGYRCWKDEAAANEWINFMKTTFPWGNIIELKIFGDSLPWEGLDKIPIAANPEDLIF